MYSKIFKTQKIVLIILCIAVSSVRCENDHGIEFKSLLVNSEGAEIDSFQLGENVRFEFYLINRNDYSVYIDPSCETWIDFLKVYQKSTDGNGKTKYIYIGQPRIFCPTMGKKVTIEPEEKKWIITLPLSEYSIWPILWTPNDYYVESIYKVVINSEEMEFKDKIYFTIY